MQNNKVLKQRAKLYDDLITCPYGDCGHKFSTATDMELHINNAHQQRLLATEWWTQFKKALFKDKDDLQITDSKSDYNSFKFSELSTAFKDVKRKNRGDF